MRKITIIISFFILLDFGLKAQESFEITVGGEGEELPYDIKALDDGSYTILGRTNSFGAGDHDIIFFNVKSDGQVNWIKTIGTDQRDVARHFIKTNDGGFLIGAWKGTGGTVDDWNVIKTDSEGNILWERFVGGTYDDELQDLIRDQNNFYLAGSTINYGNGYTHIYLSELTDDGTFLWFKVYSGGLNEHCKALRKVNNGLILGVFSKSFGNNSYSFMLVKTDLFGNIKWSKAYLTSGDDIYRDLLLTKDGGYLSVGFSNSFGSGDNDIFLLKTDSSGNVLWSKTYGGIKDDRALNIKELGDGNYIVSGETKSFGNGNGDVLLLKISPFGDVVWSKIYGGKEEERYASCDVLENGGFIIASQTQSYGEQGDIFVVKTDSLGRSCCSRDIEGVTVKNVEVTMQNVELNKNEDHEFPVWDVQESTPSVTSKLVCINSLKVIGDTVVCGESSGIVYSILPKLDGAYTWHVPDGATIVSGQGTSEIVVDFNGTSGYVTASFESYCADKISDSLFVNLSEGFNINLGSDTTFCNGNTLLLSPGSDYFHYLWQDGSTDSLYVADASGTYWVQVTDSSGCKATDSITIDTFPGFDFSIGNDTTICFGDYVFLYAPLGFESYQWQDGSDNTSYIADTSGYYWLEVTDTNNCVARDSMLLTANKVPADILGNDTLFCKDGTLTLRTNPVYEQYFWNNGSNDSVLTTSQPGKYWVTVFDTLGCSGSDTIKLDYFPAIMLELDAIGQLCEDDSVILQAVSNYNNYLWQDSSQNQTNIARDSGIYWVKVTTPCETKSDSITIDACSSIWIPNVFTPNNDGYNDYFGAVAKNIIKFKLVIFNRWGQELKTLHSINEKWDGTYRGQKAAQGTYFWVAVYEQVDRNGSAKHIRLQGSVTLIR